MAAGLALLAILAGSLIPTQMAVNAQLARAIGGPVAATLVSFLAGTVALFGMNFLVFRQYPSWSDVTSTPVWLLVVGGVIGAAALSANVFLAPRLGAAATLTFVIAGQLLAALAIDRLGLFGFTQRDFSLGRVAGVLLVFVGAALVRLS